MRNGRAASTTGALKNFHVTFVSDVHISKPQVWKKFTEMLWWAGVFMVTVSNNYYPAIEIKVQIISTVTKMRKLLL